MIEWIIGLAVAYKLVYGKKKNKPQEFTGNVIYNGIPFGYVKNGEAIKDLQ